MHARKRFMIAAVTELLSKSADVKFSLKKIKWPSFMGRIGLLHPL